MNPRWGFRSQWVWVMLCAFVALTGCAPTPTPSRQPLTVASTTRAPAALRLFIVYGGDVSAVWAGQVRVGIIEALVSEGNYQIGETLLLGEYQLPVDVGTIVMPGKTAIAAALAASQEFSPDIVVTVGTQATRLVIQAYPDPDQRIVFCSFSGNFLASGLDRPNVTGVLELPYPVQTARLAATLVPGSTRFMVLGDVSSTDAVATETIFETLLKDPPYPALPVWRQTDDWDEWQSFVLETDTVDFVLLGKYNHVHDASGNLVSPSEVLRFTLLRSTAPVFGMWQETIINGAVAGLVLSGEEQGKTVARLVLSVVGGTDPAVLLPQRPDRNVLAINLAAARHWELSPPFELLVTASFGGTFPEQ